MTDVNGFLLKSDECLIIFSYLTLWERIRLEHTSRQFRDLIFTKQRVLVFQEESVLENRKEQDFEPRDQSNEILVETDFDINLFENILKKCKNLKTLELRNICVNDITVQIISEYCGRLKHITFNVNEVTEEEIRRFGESIGFNLKSIDFIDRPEEQHIDNRDKQKILLSLCPNLKKLRFNGILSINVDFKTILPQLKELSIERQDWPESQVTAFTRLVDRYSNGSLEKISISTKESSLLFDTILELILRLSQLKELEIVVDHQQLFFSEFELLQNIVTQSKALTKITFRQKIKEFGGEEMSINLWQIFSNGNELKCIEFDDTRYHIEEPNAKLKALVNLKSLKVHCKSVDDYFFSNVTEFAPKLKTLEVICLRSKQNLSNHSMIALSKCRHLRSVKLCLFGRFEVQRISHSGTLDDIGLIHLLDNCPKLKNVRFSDTINDFAHVLRKWFEVDSKRSDKSLRFECSLSDNLFTSAMSSLSQLNVRKFVFRTIENQKEFWDHYFNRRLIIECNQSKEPIEPMELLVTCVSISSLYQSYDLWTPLGGLSCLKEFEFYDSRFDFLDSYEKIRSHEELRKIVIDCQSIGPEFFDNIREFAPNLEELSVKSRFRLEDDSLDPLLQLKRLSILKVMPPFRAEHEFTDLGINQLIDSCPELKEIDFKFVVDISMKTIDNLVSIALKNPKDFIVFKAFVIKEEMQTKNILKNLPKNLIVRTVLVEKPEVNQFD